MKGSLTLFKIRYIKFSAIAVLTYCICIIIPSTTTLLAKSPDWVVQSNMNADLLSEAFFAEDCQEKIGVSESLSEINPAFKACRQKSMIDAVRTLEQKLTQAKNPELRFDLEILLKAGRQRLRSHELDDQYRVPYINLSQAILDSLEDTLDKIESSQEQQQVILKKLKQYAGLESGKTALVSSVEQAIDAQLQKSEFALPSKDQVEEDVENNASQVLEIETFLKQQEVPNYQETYDKLKTQLYDYETFIRHEVLAKAKLEENFRFPAELYAFELEKQGIEIPAEELIEQAHTAFTQIQQQMEEMAKKIAKQRGIEISNYQDMIQVLKRERLSASETLDIYQKRAEELETIIQRENLVTLPKNRFEIRLATVEEKKDRIVPFYENVLNIVVIPVFTNSKKAKAYDDFTNSSTSWVMTVHEGRPGHDLQFATVKNLELSRARTDFARNYSNIEGWATYAEIMMQPYIPLEGQFMTLRLQLLRAAQAFLGAEFHMGKITVADVRKVWTEDLGFSRNFVDSEIGTGTPSSPGKALAYFYGSQRLLQLREQAQKKLGNKFTLKKFHDFVLSQGFLTPELLEQALSAKL